MDWTTPFVPLSQLWWNPAIRPGYSALTPVLHKKAAVYAYNHSVSLNSVVEESVAEYLLKRQG